MSLDRGPGPRYVNLVTPPRLRPDSRTASFAGMVAALSLLATSVQAQPSTAAEPEAATATADTTEPEPEPEDTNDDGAEVGPQPEPTYRLRGSAFTIPPADRLDPYGPRADNVPRLTRDQVMRYALENPAVHAAREKVEAMKAQARKAKFAWLPIIETVTTLTPGASIQCDDLVTSATYESTGVAVPADEFQFQWCRPTVGEEVDLNTVQGYFKQLSRAGVRVAFDANAVFPIFTFGKIRNTKRLAKAGVALAKLKKIQTEQELVKLVLQAHTTLMLARETQAILRDAKKVLDKAESRVNEDLGGGAGEESWDSDPDEANPDRDPNDQIRVELASVEVEQQMRQALRAEALALSALWSLAGPAAPSGFDVREQRLERFEIDGGRKSLVDYKKTAIAERPEAHMARAAIEARQAQEKLARSAFLPDLGLVVGVGFAYSSAVDRDMNRLYYQDRFNYSRVTAALALRWRWDFHNSAFDLQRSRAELRSQEYERDAAMLFLGQEVTNAYEDLIEADHRIGLAHRATELNWKLVVSFEQRDSVGEGNTGDLLRALKDWYKKRFDEAEAIHAHNEAIARLARATGTPLIAQSRRDRTVKPAAETADGTPTPKEP